jgi:hypothetical protein
MKRPSWPAKKLGGTIGLHVFTTKDDREERVLVIADAAGSYHAFVEVEAKSAARRCGARRGHTNEMWSELIEQQQKR